MFFCIVIISGSLYSQSVTRADSLIQVLNSYRRTDTIKIKKVLDVVTALENKQTEKALLYADTAVMLSEKTGYPYFKAYSLYVKGEMLTSNGNYDEAEKVLSASLSLYEKVNRPLGIADATSSLGIVSKYKKNNNQAMEYFEKAVKIYNAQKRPDLVMQTEEQMASLYGLMGDLKKAVFLKNKSIAYYEKTNNKRALAQTWGSKARYHYLSGEIPEALDCILTSLRINEETGDLKAQLFNYQNLAVLHGEINNPLKAIEYAEKGLKLNQTVKNKKLETGLKNAVCVAYAKLSDHKQAIKCYTEVITLFESAGNETAAAENYGLLVGHLLEEKQYANAFTTYQKLLKFYENGKNAINIPQELYRIGDLIMIMPDSSLQNLNIPLKNRYSESMMYLQKGLLMAREQKNLLQESALLKAISKNFEAQSQHSEAFKTFKEYVSLKDSISGDEVQKKINRSEIQYEYDKKELALKYEKQLSDELLAKQKLLTNKQQQDLKLKEQKMLLVNQEKDLAHLAFLKEQAEKEDKQQLLVISEEREKVKEQNLVLKNLELSGKQKQNLFLGLLVLLLLTGLFVLVYMYFNIKKQKNIISLQNKLNEQTISILSHDIKEPLLGVRLMLKKLNVDDPFLVKASQSLESQINSVNSILNNLLKLKKVALLENKSNVKANVSSIVQEVSAQLHQAISEKQLKIENQLPSDFLLPIAPEKLQVIVYNILSNAVKFSHANQTVNIFKDGRGFCIRDYGIGLSDEKMLKLMSEVQQAEPGTTNEYGHGLGLLYVGMLLQNEQVRVIFDSPDGGGTLVKIIF